VAAFNFIVSGGFTRNAQTFASGTGTLNLSVNYNNNTSDALNCATDRFDQAIVYKYWSEVSYFFPTVISAQVVSLNVNTCRELTIAASSIGRTFFYAYGWVQPLTVNGKVTINQPTTNSLTNA